MIFVLVFMVIGVSGMKEEKGMCVMVVNGIGYFCEEYIVEIEDGFLLGL